MKKHIKVLVSILILASFISNVYAIGDIASKEMSDLSPSVHVEILEDGNVIENTSEEITDDVATENITEENINAITEDEVFNGMEEQETQDVEFVSDTEIDDAFSTYSLTEPETDSWTNIASMLEYKADCDMLIVDDELYAIGGMGSNGYAYTIAKYSSLTNSWQSVTTIPNEIKGFAVAAHGSDIYIIGGYKNNDYSNEVNIYNVETKSWTVGTPMNKKRDQAAAMYADNKIYVFGGRNRDGFASSYEFYDLTTGEWDLVTTGFADSLIRVGADVKYIGGYICVYGGIDKTYSYCGVDLYLAENMRQTQELLADGYDNISIAWGAEKGLLFANNTTTNESLVKELTVVDNSVFTEDVVFETNLVAGKYSKYIIYDGYLYCVGGYNATSKAYLNTVRKYSVYYGDYVTGEGSINSSVTADGNTITMNVEAGKEYVFRVNVENIEQLSGYTFTIEYPQNSFEIIDACALTYEKETSVGVVSGSNVTITEFQPHGLSFTSSEPIPDGKKMNGSVNAVILKANSSGQRSIVYGMTYEEVE